MPTTRRDVLSGTALTLGSVAVAGCGALSDDPRADEPPPPATSDSPDPSSHVYGANGQWSSVGCNVANNRVVANATVSPDGLSEHWRVDAGALRDEPVVADGHVYLVRSSGGLVVLDADGGERLWELSAAAWPPMVRDGTAYVPTERQLWAVEAATGEPLWRETLTSEGVVTPAATYDGETLFCGAGDRVVALDAATGETEWERSVFGQAFGSPLLLEWVGPVVTTLAGELYWLDHDDGSGVFRWALPGEPIDPPSADRDTVYVNCEPGATVALRLNSSYWKRRWTADTNRASGGVATPDGHDLALISSEGTLQALNTSSGDHYWEYDIGDYGLSAPAYARDTVFVGGDRLRAVDPSPNDDPSAGPALRFERDLGGSVGPGPIVADGSVYVLVRPESGRDELVALS